MQNCPRKDDGPGDYNYCFGGLWLSAQLSTIGLIFLLLLCIHVCVYNFYDHVCLYYDEYKFFSAAIPGKKGVSKLV